MEGYLAYWLIIILVVWTIKIIILRVFIKKKIAKTTLEKSVWIL